MRKIIDYIVITAENPFALADNVNLAIGQGWQPLGGLSSMSYTNRAEFTQSMVKYEE